MLLELQTDQCTREQLGECVESAKSHIKGLMEDNNKISELWKEIDGLQTKAGEHDKEIRLAQERNDNLVRDRSASEKAIQQNRGQISALDCSLKNAEAQLRVEMAERARLQEQLMEAQESLKQAGEHCTNVQEQREQAVHEFAALKRQLDIDKRESSAELSDLQEQLQNVRYARDDYEKRLNQTKAELERARAQLQAGLISNRDEPRSHRDAEVGLSFDND